MTARSVSPGDVYGRLTVLASADDYVSPRGRRCTQVWVRCSCGAERVVRVDNVRSGRSRSCGCLRSEALTAHNRRRTEAQP